MPKTYTHDELVDQMKAPGWQHSAGTDSTKDGTLEEALTASHRRHKEGEHPGLIQQLETSIELDMIQIEKLWRYLGLPV